MKESHGSVALQRLLDALPDAVLETHAQHGDATAIVERTRLIEVMRLLRDTPDTAFEMLADLTCVDHLPASPRFEMVYHLFSLSRRHRVRIKVRIDEADCEVDTLIPVWPSANWLEREVWDLYGVRFRGHPDLRRLLLYEEFEGHPLRKDYPKEKRQPLVGPRN